MSELGYVRVDDQGRQQSVDEAYQDHVVSVARCHICYSKVAALVALDDELIVRTVGGRWLSKNAARGWFESYPEAWADAARRFASENDVDPDKAIEVAQSIPSQYPKFNKSGPGYYLLDRGVLDEGNAIGVPSGCSGRCRRRGWVVVLPDRSCTFRLPGEHTIPFHS